MKSTPVKVANRIDLINILDECVDQVIHECLNQELIEPYKDHGTPDQLMEATSYFPSPMILRFEPLRRDDDPKVTTPGAKVDLEFKPLPCNLRYAFFNSNYEFPFIVNSSQPSADVDALYDVLLNHNNTLVLERLANFSYFCYLDGLSCFCQIPIHPEDQSKTTFTFPYDTFAFRRMPFGLCNAPVTFQ